MEMKHPVHSNALVAEHLDDLGLSGAEYSCASRESIYVSDAPFACFSGGWFSLQIL
jgi:hypothetical protein